MKKPLIIITGPTATGKTSLAVSIAKKINGHLISADSRQIYKGMDIGTGKDHPSGIGISLVDILKPNQLFSVTDFYKRAYEEIIKAWNREQVPIVVGGTIQYIDALITGPKSTFEIPPNKLLRRLLNPLPKNVLQFILRNINFPLYHSLNVSDVQNPHRLIRKIELTLSSKPKNLLPSLPPHRSFTIVLDAPNQFLYRKIDQRIEQRIKLGLLREIGTLIKSYSWDEPGLNTLAYKEFKSFFQKKTTLELSIQRWIKDEHAYLRRQKTYLKKLPISYLVDVSTPDYQKNTQNWILKMLKSSYETNKS